MKMTAIKTRVIGFDYFDLRMRNTVSFECKKARLDGEGWSRKH